MRLPFFNQDIRNLRRQAHDSQEEIKKASVFVTKETAALAPRNPLSDPSHKDALWRLQKVMDGWANVFAGMGMRGDKREHTRFSQWELIQDPELQIAYLGDGLVTKVVNCVADDMTREWIKLTGDHEDDEETVMAIKDVGAVLEELDSEMAFNLALKWARLYGGSLVVMGIMDGIEPDQPVSLNAVRGISGLRVVDRVDVHIWNSIFDTDVLSPTFGQPAVYDCIFHVGTTRVEQYIHATRCIPIYGRRVPQNTAYLMNMEHRYWGLSELQFAWETLRDMGTSRSAAINLLMELTIGKYTIDGLAGMIAEGNESQVLARMEIINQAKSIIHGVLLGENEKYERDSITLEGLPQTIDRLMMFLSGVTEIPVTRLFGRSAAGMNATGEGDMNFYYDMIRSRQKTQLKPALRRLVDVIRAWRRIDLPIDIEFNPLEQMSEKEEAEIESKKATAMLQKAQAYSAYINDGVLQAEEVFAMEFQGDIESKMAEMAREGRTFGQIATPQSKGVEIGLENAPVEPVQPPVVQKVPPQQRIQVQPRPPSAVPLQHKAFPGVTSEEGGGPS